MATIEFKQKYRHDNDCVMSGCPGHEATIRYQSTSDYVTFDDGYNECQFGMDLNTLRTFRELLAKLEYRVEIASTKPKDKTNDSR